MRDNGNKTSSDRFYEGIAPFDNFSEVTSLNHYHPAPDDWHVVISDIVDSTGAIECGRYKDVNMVGAACITAALNSTRGIQIPYVFGGDGATLLIPSSALEAVTVALEKLQAFTLQEFEFTLRAGHQSVADIRRGGEDVLVAKLALSPNNHLAMFTGGGIATVDRLMKEGDPAITLLTAYDQNSPPDLTGLSCRWKPLDSLRGQMLSVLIVPTAPTTRERTAIIADVLSDFRSALADDIDTLRPTSAANMHLPWAPHELHLEAKLTKGAKPLYRQWSSVLFNSLLQKFLDFLNLKLGDFDAAEYRNELRANTDFRRYDDTLRLVLDCTSDQIEAIKNILNKYRKNKRLQFGVHKSDQALMTCLVFSIADHEHIHFIDGADGGFAVAAKQMKVGNS